jgi:hypothetical protein
MAVFWESSHNKNKNIVEGGGGGGGHYNNYVEIIRI